MRTPCTVQVLAGPVYIALMNGRALLLAAFSPRRPRLYGSQLFRRRRAILSRLTPFPGLKDTGNHQQEQHDCSEYQEM